MKLKIFRCAAFLLLILWMIVIFSLSSQNATVSSETSGGFIEDVAKMIYPHFNELDKDEQEAVVERFQFIVRKCAHFTAYALLGILSFLTFVSYRQLFLRMRVIISSGVCLLYSVSDEIHQLFVPGRSGEIRDVCIDFCGSMAAIMLCLLITHFNKRIKNTVRWSGNGEQ